jgi:ATP-binding cassette subfamily F protein 1
MRVQVSDREQKKLNDKQRRLQETAARNKADALRDDDNVFDVSYESQGGAGDAGDTVSATDIKVGYRTSTLCPFVR